MKHRYSLKRWSGQSPSGNKRQQSMTITISSVSGSRTFTAKQNLKMKLYWGFGLLTAYCVGMTGTGVYLLDKYQQAGTLWTQNKHLLDYKANIEDEQAREQVRFDIRNINKTSLAKKEVFLHIIPSGNPLPDLDVKVTSGFGRRNHPVLGEILAHNGLDIRAPIGTRVQATANGMVSVSEHQNGYGNVVKIEHAFGFQTVYAHLNKLLVKPGDLIKKGTIIAESGNTGRSTGPHLHYEVRFKTMPLDSANFINWNQQDFDYVFKNEKEVEWAFFVNEVI